MRFVSDMYDLEKSPYRLTGDELSAYCEEIGLLGAKHIFLFAGETEEEDAAVLERAKQILARLDAGEDFDALMQEFSEDPGLAQYPDGYTFMEGEMVPEFTEATAALQIGEYSGIVPSSSGGYHIILRIEPSPDDAAVYAIDNQLYNDFEARIQAAEVSYGRGYANISYADFADVVETAVAQMEQQSDGDAADGDGADQNQDASGTDEEPKG